MEVAGPFARDMRAAALTTQADAVVIATSSFLAEVAPDIRLAVECGSNVVTTAEEAAYPEAIDVEIARELDSLAREHGVSILGTGLNPGFSFDALVLTASGVVATLDSIRVERIVDLSKFSATILRRLGIGFSGDEFAQRVDDGTITGHIGFPQSMRLVAGELGLALSNIDRFIEPILCDRVHHAAHLAVEPGTSAGFRQRYVGYVGSRPWFEANFVGHVAPETAGLSPRDEINLSGTSPVHLTIEPGVDPQAGSSAMIANSLCRVIAAAPGWLTVGGLPPARPI